MTELLRRQILPAKRNLLHEAWEQGALTAPTLEGTMQLNAKAIGECNTLVWLMNLDYEILKGEMEHGESERTGTVRTSSAG